jgi:hypothetical protein
MHKQGKAYYFEKFKSESVVSNSCNDTIVWY